MNSSTGQLTAALGSVGMRSAIIGGSGPAPPFPAMALRLQSHNLIAGPTVAGVSITSSGSVPAGNYIQANPSDPTQGFFNPSLENAASVTGWKVVWDGTQWHIQDIGTSTTYYSGGTDSAGPWIGSWSTVSPGINPAPTVTQATLSTYAPLGLYQTSDTFTPCVNWGDPVYHWDDVLSGNGMSAVQSNSLLQGQLNWAPNVSGVWVPYLALNGSNNYYALYNLSSYTAGTIVVGLKSNSAETGGMQGLWKFSEAVSSNTEWYPYFGTVYENWGQATRPSFSPVVDITTWHTYSVRSASSFYDVQQDGSVAYSSNTNTVGFDNATAEIFHNEESSYFGGGTTFVGIADSKLSDADLSTVQNKAASLAPA